MARARAQQPPTLRFRGPPQGLEALAPAALVPEDADPATVVLKLGRVEQVAPLDSTEIAAGASYLRFSLSSTTTPGTYEGRAKVGKQEFPVVAEVEPSPSLQLSPTQLTIEAAPGAEASAHATILNDGNVGLEIGRAYAFGLFADDGIEEAFAIAFREETARGEGRFGRFVEGLASHHGGFTRVKVAEGAGVLEPGDLRQVALEFRFPDELEAGKTYGGTLMLHGFSYAIRATVPPATVPATRRRKAG
jgi:hypothetical protein